MMRTPTLFFAITLATITAPIATAAGDEAALESLIHEFLAAASLNDAAMHERFWSEDLIYTSSSGERFGKQRILDGLAEAEPGAETRTPTYHAEDLTIQRFDGFAVATFRLVATGPGASRETYFNTGVFRLENDQWRTFVWQATRADP